MLRALALLAILPVVAACNPAASPPASLSLSTPEASTTIESPAASMGLESPSSSTGAASSGLDTASPQVSP